MSSTKKTSLDKDVIEYAEGLGESQPHTAQLYAIKARKLRSNFIILLLEKEAIAARNNRLLKQKTVPEWCAEEFKSLTKFHLAVEDKEKLALLSCTYNYPVLIMKEKKEIVRDLRMVEKYPSWYKRSLLKIRRKPIVLQTTQSKLKPRKEKVNSFNIGYGTETTISCFEHLLKLIFKRKKEHFRKFNEYIKDYYQEPSQEERRWAFIQRFIKLRGEDEENIRLSSMDAVDTLIGLAIKKGALKKQKEIADTLAKKEK